MTQPPESERAAAQAPETSARAGAWLWLKLAVSLAALAAIAVHVDLGQAARALGAASPGPLIVAVLLHALVNVSIGLRWALILRAAGAPLGPIGAMRATWEGAFFNQVLPTSMGGDVVRVWRARRAGQPLAGAVNLVLLDRIAGLFGLAVLIALTAPWLARAIGDRAVTVATAAAIGLCLAVVLGLLLGERLAFLVPGRLGDSLAALGAETRRALARPDIVLVVIVLSVAGHVVAALIAYVVARDLGLALSLGEALVLFPPVVLATMIPVSFAGWGLREGAAVALLAMAGLGGDGALALSVAFGLTQIAAALPGGALWLVADNKMPPPGG